MTISFRTGNFFPKQHDAADDWGEVCVWEGATGKKVAKYMAAPDEGLPSLGEVFQLVFSEDGKRLTVVSGPAGVK